MKALTGLLWIIVLCVSHIVQAQNCRWFDKFTITEYAHQTEGHINIDSIPITVRKVKVSHRKDKCSYKFEIVYGGLSKTFWIGIADSTVYVFKGKLSKPLKLFSFSGEVKYNENIAADPANFDIREFRDANNNSFYSDDNVYLIRPGNKLGVSIPGIRIVEIYFVLHRGIYFVFYKDDEPGVYYSTLKEL
jgi:hypothetical protein